MIKPVGKPTVVSFIGAGPGAPDLITVRGRRRLARADVVLYADSLVHPGILRYAKAGAEVRGTASMTLEEITALMVAAARAGKRVVRVHSGDPSLYGAIHEQMERLAEAGVAYELIPGVSAVSAAAASLGAELTRPGLAQTVILTRAGGRTGMPPGEALEELARHGATLVLYLSAGHLARVVRDLRAGGYPENTPVVVVYRASWEDERILRGTLATIAGQVRAAKLTRQALILVGRVFGADSRAEARSRLYDPSFSHLYRRGVRAKGGE
ncbi:precorrin-4 C(11)-methyltransferase [Nitrospira sp. Kam-Ns4a]